MFKSKTKCCRLFLRILPLYVAFLLVVACVFAGCNFGGGSERWVRNTIQKNYYRFDGDYSEIENLDGLTVDEMVAKLDIYSAYYTRDEYAAVIADNNGSKSGIGISYAFVEGEGVVLYTVVGNSPAQKAGLKAGDVIVGATAQGNTKNFQTANDFSEFVTARVTGEQFTLNLADGNSVTLSKEEYTASYASMYTRDKSFEIEYDSGVRNVAIDNEGGIPQLPDGTAYIYLYQFFGNAADEIGVLFDYFREEGCTSLILDLRDNGGGYVDVMSQIGGRFVSDLSLSSGAVAMEARYKSGKKQIEYCKSYTTGTLPAGTDVYVMANDGTASASEALIGVLVSYDITSYGNIFLSQYGTAEAKSYGKGIMQSTFVNPLSHSALKLTVAGIYWANGKTIHDVGLTVSDGCVAAPAPDDIVNVGYDYELLPVIEKIIADRG